MRQLIFIAAVLFVGCKETKLFEEKKKIELKQLNTNELKIKYLGQDEPNKYDVQLNWAPSSGFLVLKKNEQSFFDSSRVSNTNSYIFKNLIGGTKYSVVADVYSAEGSLVESTVLNINVPLDFVLSGTVQLDKTQELNYQRVFIEDEATIYTMQYDLKIAAVELIAGNNTRIQNFPDNNHANFELKGLDAGNIEIRALIAKGELEIIQNSQIGGAGYQGTPKFTTCEPMITEREPPICTDINHKACAGTNGGNSGKLGDLKFFADQSDDLSLKYKKIYVSGGPAGPHGNNAIKDYPVKSKGDEQCDVAPISGTPAFGGTSCVILSRSDIYDCQQ